MLEKGVKAYGTVVSGASGIVIGVEQNIGVEVLAGLDGAGAAVVGLFALGAGVAAFASAINDFQNNKF